MVWMDEVDSKVKKSLQMYVNPKVAEMLAVCIKSTSVKCLYYKLTYKFDLDEVIPDYFLHIYI
jgi:hypothetical protein